MKKLIVLLLILSVTLLGNYPFSTKSIDAIVKLSKKVDLMIEGKVVNVEHYYILDNQQIDESEITEETLKRELKVYTKLSVKILKKFKIVNRLESDIIDVWIQGGIFYINGKLWYSQTTHTAYPYLDPEDQMIMGLIKNLENNRIESILEGYNEGFYFYKGTDLQIPSSSEMIEIVEDGELEKAEKKVYRKKLKEIENEENREISDEFPSYEALKYNLIVAESKKYEIIEKKENFVEDLKKRLMHLGGSYE